MMNGRTVGLTHVQKVFHKLPNTAFGHRQEIKVEEVIQYKKLGEYKFREWKYMYVHKIKYLNNRNLESSAVF